MPDGLDRAENRLQLRHSFTGAATPSHQADGSRRALGCDYLLLVDHPQGELSPTNLSLPHRANTQPQTVNQ